MDLQRKTIQGLTGSLDEKREALVSFSRQFGERLLEDSANPSVLGGAVSEEKTNAWQKLIAIRESDTATVLSIRENVTRKNELQQFKKELDKTLLQTRESCNSILLQFGYELFDNYTKDLEGFFADTYEKAAVVRNELLTLEQQKEDYKIELEKSGFLGKIFSQFKMSGLTSSIRQHKEELDAIILKGVTARMENDSFIEYFSGEEAKQEFIGTFTEAKNNLDKLEDILKRSDSLSADLLAVDEALRSFGADENPNRRMEELRTKIRETDRKIDSLSSQVAKEYCDKFLDDEGSSLLGGTGDGHSFSDMGTYAHQLEQVALFRHEISVIRRKIDILETEIKIVALDKSISSYNKLTSDYERKIIHYKEMISELKQSSKEATEDRDRLLGLKETLESSLQNISPVT